MRLFLAALFALVTITALLAPAGATETKPAFVGGPTISGTPAVGETLTATAGSWTDLRGQITFQWRACRGTQPDRRCAVFGTGSPTVVLSAAERGARIGVQVAVSGPFGGPGREMSRFTAPVDAPLAISAPAVSGTPVLGGTLSASLGGWSPNTTGFSYQWQACEKVAGAVTCEVFDDDASSVVLGPDQAGKKVRVRITGSNEFGSTNSLSQATTPVGFPINQGLPQIDPTFLKVGETLRTSAGSWLTDEASTYRYQWQSCTGVEDSTCTAFGTRTPTVELGWAQVGTTVRSRVSVTNATGTTRAYSARTATVPRPPQYTQVDVSGLNTCAVTGAQTVRCWGSEVEAVPSDLGTVTQVATGARFACAVTTSDAVRCWGTDWFGSLDVPTDLGPVSQVAAEFGVCAVLVSGAVRCWGANGFLSAPQLMGPAVRVTVGHQHACAKLEGSAFQCWGYPQDAQVPQDIGGAADLSAGFSSTCARSETGAVRCWEDYGRDRVDYPVPTDLPPIGQLSSRRRDACGVVAGTGEVRCWGPNLHGQSTVPAGLPPVSQVATSLYHSCAILRLDGSLTCWGERYALPVP